jgi:predicted PurR-regulated permease PerM
MKEERDMSANTPATAQGETATDELSSSRGRRRKLITALMILAFLAIIAIALYALSLIAGAVILLLLSALLAYIIYPLVQLLHRRLLRSLAIGVAYLLVAGAVVGGMFIVASALIQQSTSLVHSIQFLLSPAGERQIQPVIDFLGKLGITQDQVAQVKNQLFSLVQSALSGVLPFLIGAFTNITDLIVVVTLSVYFVIDGPRIIGWLRLKTPATQRGTINFLLNTLDQSLGGYFRGSLLIALIGALSTGVGLTLLHVPYAALLGVLFFLLYFVPVIGANVIGVLCILAALPEGWVVTLIVAIFIMVLQGVVIGQILSPRIFSKTVGVHPIVAIFALFAGAELFGLLGGFLSVPVAGALQHIIVALWNRWKDEHPDQFPQEEEPLQPSASLPGQQIAPTETPATSSRP